MKVEDVAKALKELGHPVRLTIFKLLVKSGYKGCAVGEIQVELNIPNSTLSHHIAKLVSVDLVKQHRDGRTLFCIPQYGRLNSLIVFLSKECCINQK